MKLNIRTKSNLFMLNEKCEQIKIVEENDLMHFVAIKLYKEKIERRNIFLQKVEDYEVAYEKKILLTIPKSEYLYSYDPSVTEPMGE